MKMKQKYFDEKWNSEQIGKITGNAYKLLFYLQTEWDDKMGYAYPTYEEIGKHTSLSKRTVVRCLKELKENDLIKSVRDYSQQWKCELKTPTFVWVKYYINSPKMNADIWNEIKVKDIDGD